MASLRPVDQPAAGPASTAAEAATTATAEAAAADLIVSAATLEDIKNDGNAKFKAGSFSEASEAYSRCIDACKLALKPALADSSAKREEGPLPGARLPQDACTKEQLRGVLAAAYCNRSMCRLKQQDLKGAEADSRAALEIQPDYIKALYRHAVALQLLGDLTGCVSSLRRLLRIDPKHAEASRLLLQLKETVLQQQQQHQHSMLPSSLLDVATDASAAVPKRVKALRDLGRMVQERGALQETLAKEGLLQRLALFLKQQNAAKSAAVDAAAPSVSAAGAAASVSVAAPAAVEAAGWELVSSVVQLSPLGVPLDDSSDSSAAREKALFGLNQKLSLPVPTRMCRETLRKVWTSEDLLFTLRRLLRQGLLDPPQDYFTRLFAANSSSSSSLDDRRWRGLSAVYLLRSLGYLKQSEAEEFEHDSSFLEAVASGLDCGEAPGVQLAALHALASAADARRRLGLKAKALALRHGIERSLEASLALLSSAADREECGEGQTQRETLERNVELTVVTILSLLGDKERAEADKVDMQRLTDQLLAPFLTHCCSKDPSKQAETYVGLKALQFLITADRDSAKEFILQGSLLPHILSVATGEAAARAGLSGTKQQRQQQQTATEVLLHCLDHLELRQKMLDEDGVEAVLQLLRQSTLSKTHRAKLAVALARICVHSKIVKEEVLDRVDFSSLLEEMLQDQQQVQQQQQQQQQQNKKGLDENMAQCVLELFFFLSLHAEFKTRLLETGKAQKGQTDLLGAVMEVGWQYCTSNSKNSSSKNSSSSSSSKSSSKSSSLPRYLLCGGLCNLMKSRADKERRPRKRGLQGGMDLDEGQMQELEALYEHLPAEAKPVPNGEIDAGDEASILSLRQLLLQRGVGKLLARACTTKPLPSPNVLLVAGDAFCLLAKDEKARGRLVQEGAIKALLAGIGALRGSPEEQRDLQQVAAQLSITVNPCLFPSHEALDLVPALLPLLTDSHELLQYEGALALTNLTSVNEELRQRAFAGGAWAKLGDLLFSDNDLLRAAGLEGWCNLAACIKLQEFIGERAGQSDDSQDLRLLLAFCLETNNQRAQQAAAGALATLLNNSAIAKALPRYETYGNLFKALEEASEEEGPLLDRIVACLFNVWSEEIEGDAGKSVKEDIEKNLRTHRDKLKGLAAKLATQILASGDPQPPSTSASTMA